jgi:hypothetical protein
MKKRGTLEISKMTGPQLTVVNFFEMYHTSLVQNKDHSHCFECDCELARSIQALYNIEKIIKNSSP